MKKYIYILAILATTLLSAQTSGYGDIEFSSQGADGTNGTNGNTVLTGAVDPTTEGVDGDSYINTTSSEIFYKSSGTWSAGTSLVGGLLEVVDDTTPQLGGDLDLNSNDITGTGNIDITGTGEFTGTVSGDDPVNDDDFVTKGYNFETGTWTPVLTDTGGGATYTFTVNSAIYMKQESLVHIKLRLTSINQTGSLSGSFQITGFPFSALSNADAFTLGGFSNCGVSYYSGYGRITGTTTPILSILGQTALDGSNTTPLIGTISNGTIEISGFYESSE